MSKELTCSVLRRTQILAVDNPLTSSDLFSYDSLTSGRSFFTKALIPLSLLYRVSIGTGGIKSSLLTEDKMAHFLSIVQSCKETLEKEGKLQVWCRSLISSTVLYKQMVYQQAKEIILTKFIKNMISIHLKCIIEATDKCTQFSRSHWHFKVKKLISCLEIVEWRW